MRIVGTLIVALVIACAGCELQVDTTPKTMAPTGISYRDAKEQERFKRALSKAGIPYEVSVHKNQEFVDWDPSYSEAVEEVKDSLLPLPPGRHINLDERRQSLFKEWLKQRKVPYTTKIVDKREFIIWEKADANRVRAWEGFPSYYDEMQAPPRQ